jgi:fructose-specific phosphotransferase system IIC component
VSVFAFLGGLVLGFAAGLLVSVSEDMVYQWRARRAPRDDGTADRDG